MGTPDPWPQRVSDAHSYLVRRGHVDPIVAVSTPVGRVTGLGYEESLMTRVIEPLGLTATSFADEPLCPGHHRGRDVAPWHLGAMAGAGGEVLMHDGGTLGARSEVRLERHSGTAVVVLGDGRRGTARAASKLLNPH